MKEYLISVLVISAISGMCSRICYEGGYGRLAVAVVTLYVIASPIAMLCESIDADRIFSDMNISDELPSGEYTEVAREAVESGIRDAVCEEFSIGRDSVRVAIVDFDFSSMRAGEIRVYLSFAASHTALGDVESFIERLNLGECRAEYEIG